MQFFKKLHSKFKHGLSTIYYQDVVRYEILKTRAFTETTSKAAEIHVLVSKHDWLNLVWALKSFYHYSERDYSLCIHDDGTLTLQQKDILSNHFPNSRLIEKTAADQRMLKLLQNHPRCLEFRKSNNLSPKVLDSIEYLESDRMVFFDSDLLFFDKPEKMLKRIEDRNYQLNSLNRDATKAYMDIVEPKLVKKLTGVNLQEKINSGLGLVHKKSIQLSWIEEFLGLPPLLGLAVPLAKLS